MEDNCLNGKYCKICNLEYFIEDTWISFLKEEFGKDYFKELKRNLHKDGKFSPGVHELFAFTYLPKFENIKLVIMGQNPYEFQPKCGFGFSAAAPYQPITPTLRVVFEALNKIDPKLEFPNADLKPWAEQGVFLFDSGLTTGPEGSYLRKIFPDIDDGTQGWQPFTTKMLEVIAKNQRNVVFMLWGNHAKINATKIKEINNDHLVLESYLPTAYEFFSLENLSEQFVLANDYLKKHGLGEINWDLNPKNMQIQFKKEDFN